MRFDQEHPAEETRDRNRDRGVKRKRVRGKSKRDTERRVEFGFPSALT